jgi:hypothetical protein
LTALASAPDADAVRLLFFQTGWGSADAGLEPFLARAREAGFDGVELYLDAIDEEPPRVDALLREHGLALIALIAGAGTSPQEQTASLERSYLHGVACGAMAVNCHTGRDHWPLERNLPVFVATSALEAQYGVPLHHETHRGRATFSLPSTVALLDAMPGLSLTADLSHWMVVHESDLRDQEERLERVVGHARHVHARVGHAQAPQVPDLRDPVWREQLARHLELWRRIAERAAAAGHDVLTITSEYGPPPYLPTLPFTHDPVADAWDLNVAMRDIVRDELLHVADE